VLQNDAAPVRRIPRLHRRRCRGGETLEEKTLQVAPLMEKLVSLCKRRGFIFQSSEIYGGLNSCYDYGPLGIELKNNIKSVWWRAMTYHHDNIEGVDASILMHPRVWEASGHVSAFTDPLVDCKTCKARFRADQLVNRTARASRASRRGSTTSASSPNRATSTSCSRLSWGRWRTRRRSSTCAPRPRRAFSSTS
jgi:glycyl-tRNA synthetase (class II)